MPSARTRARSPNRLIIGPSQPFTTNAAMPLGLTPGVQLALPCDLGVAAASSSGACVHVLVAAVRRSTGVPFPQRLLHMLLVIHPTR